MLGDLKVNYVASFGNLVNSKNISDWVEIENPFYPPGVIQTTFKFDYLNK